SESLAPHELVRRRQRVERAGVRPPTRETVTLQGPGAQVVVVDVRDLQLAAGARFEGADDVEDLRVVEIDPHHRQIALRLLRLLHDADDARTIHLGDAVTLGVVDLLEQEPRAAPLFAERLHAGADIVREDVVAEDHADQLLAGEILGEPERLRDSARLVLDLVGEAAAEVLAGPEQRHHVAHVLHARDDEDLFDPGRDELADGMEDHRLAAHRKEVFVRHLGERKQAGPGSAGEDDALHRGSLTGRVVPESAGKAKKDHRLLQSHARSNAMVAIAALTRPGMAAPTQGAIAPETAMACEITEAAQRTSESAIPKATAPASGIRRRGRRSVNVNPTAASAAGTTWTGVATRSARVTSYSRVGWPAFSRKRTCSRSCRQGSWRGRPLRSCRSAGVSGNSSMSTSARRSKMVPPGPPYSS